MKLNFPVTIYFFYKKKRNLYPNEVYLDFCHYFREYRKQCHIFRDGIKSSSNVANSYIFCKNINTNIMN